MATISSIGSSGRNYSSIQAWHDAFAPGGWIGELYNDSEFVLTGSKVQFNGKATSATDYITLRCAAGQSFRDNAGAKTNPLCYDQTKGVGIRCNVSYNQGLYVNEGFVTFSGIQFAEAGSGQGTLYGDSGAPSLVVEDCILETVTGRPSSVIQWNAANGLARNCLFVMRNDGNAARCFGAQYVDTVRLANCTFVRPSNFAQNAMGAANIPSGRTVTITNCAFFNFASFYDSGYGTPTMAGSNNCTDLASGWGTANQASKIFANQFVTTTDTGRDFRLKTGADCIDHGITDTTDIPAADDIAKTSRPQGSSWDIGAWEFVVPGQTTGVGTASGSSTANAVGRAQINSVGTASGASTALATGSAQARGVGTASGTSSAVATSLQIFPMQPVINFLG